MSNGFPFIDIIFFAAVALFIAVRLRGVLGRRTGHEQRPAPPVSTGERDNVVKLPGRDDPADASFNDIADPELRSGLEAIREADPNFDLDFFLSGARGAFEMIVTAFARGDTDTLKPLLADDVYNGFAGAIEQRTAAGETLETEIAGFKTVEAIEARMQGARALLTVRFVTEQTNVSRDASGNVIDGDPSELGEIVDVWTFARDTTFADPNWLLASTSVDD